MVVSFRFFLTLNSDDGSKPTPTMETQPVFDGDGKLWYYFRLPFPTRFQVWGGQVFPSGVCLSIIILCSFFNFHFSQCTLGCFDLLNKCKPSQELVHLPLLERPSVLARLSAWLLVASNSTACRDPGCCQDWGATAEEDRQAGTAPSGNEPAPRSSCPGPSFVLSLWGTKEKQNRQSPTLKTVASPGGLCVLNYWSQL